MTQEEIDRAVARATGESVTTIRRLGFLIAEPGVRVVDPDSEEHGPYVIDWDLLDQPSQERCRGRSTY